MFCLKHGIFHLLTHLGLKTEVSYRTLTHFPMKVNGRNTYYWVLVEYRDASTQWKWMKRWVKKMRPRYPRTIMKCKSGNAAYGNPPFNRAAWNQSAKVDMFISDALGQAPRDYLHSSALPITSRFGYPASDPAISAPLLETKHTGSSCR